MVICLQRGADLHITLLMSLPLTISCSVKFRLVLPFWYWLTLVVPVLLLYVDYTCYIKIKCVYLNFKNKTT